MASRGVHSRYVHIKDTNTENKAPFAVGPTRTRLSTRGKDTVKKVKKTTNKHTLSTDNTETNNNTPKTTRDRHQETINKKFTSYVSEKANKKINSSLENRPKWGQHVPEKKAKDDYIYSYRNSLKRTESTKNTAKQPLYSETSNDYLRRKKYKKEEEMKKIPTLSTSSSEDDLSFTKLNSDIHQNKLIPDIKLKTSKEIESARRLLESSSDDENLSEIHHSIKNPFIINTKSTKHQDSNDFYTSDTTTSDQFTLPKQYESKSKRTIKKAENQMKKSKDLIGIIDSTSELTYEESSIITPLTNKNSTTQSKPIIKLSISSSYSYSANDDLASENDLLKATIRILNDTIDGLRNENNMLKTLHTNDNLSPSKEEKKSPLKHVPPPHIIKLEEKVSSDNSDIDTITTTENAYCDTLTAESTTETNEEKVFKQAEPLLDFDYEEESEKSITSEKIPSSSNMEIETENYTTENSVNNDNLLHSIKKHLQNNSFSPLSKGKIESSSETISDPVNDLEHEKYSVSIGKENAWSSSSDDDVFIEENIAVKVVKSASPTKNVPKKQEDEDKKESINEETSTPLNSDNIITVKTSQQDYSCQDHGESTEDLYTKLAPKPYDYCNSPIKDLVDKIPDDSDNGKETYIISPAKNTVASDSDSSFDDNQNNINNDNNTNKELQKNDSYSEYSEEFDQEDILFRPKPVISTTDKSLHTEETDSSYEETSIEKEQSTLPKSPERYITMHISSSTSSDLESSNDFIVKRKSPKESKKELLDLHLNYSSNEEENENSSSSSSEDSEEEEVPRFVSKRNSLSTLQQISLMNGEANISKEKEHDTNVSSNVPKPLEQIEDSSYYSEEESEKDLSLQARNYLLDDSTDSDDIDEFLKTPANQIELFNKYSNKNIDKYSDSEEEDNQATVKVGYQEYQTPRVIIQKSPPKEEEEEEEESSTGNYISNDYNNKKKDISMKEKLKMYGVDLDFYSDLSN